MARASSIIIQPPAWLGGPPLIQGGNFDAAQLKDEVGRWTTSGGTSLRALRGGRIVFAFTGDKFRRPELVGGALPDFETLGRMHRERIVIMNSYLVALYRSILLDRSVITKKMVVKSSQMFSSSSFDADDLGWSGTDISLGYLESATQAHSYNDDLPMEYDSRIRGREYNIIDTKTLVSAFDLFQSFEIVENKNCFSLIDLYLRSIVSCEEHDYAASLISSWAIIEKLLEVCWQRSLRSRVEAGNMTPERKNRIVDDHRTYSAAVRLEVLETGGQIDPGLYTNTNALRKTRNDWIHNLKPVSMQDAVLGGVVASRWFKAELGVEIECAPALQLGGL